MTYKLSRRDIRSFTILCRIGRVLCVIPSYDFKSGRNVRPMWDKIQAIFTFTIITSAVSFGLHQRIMFLKSTTQNTIVDIASDSCLTFLIFTMILGSSFWNQNNWTNLFTTFQILDAKLKNRNKPQRSFFDNIYLQLVLINILYSVCLAQALLLWNIFNRSLSFAAYVGHQTCYYYECYIHALIFNFARAFQFRYEDVNKLLAGKIELQTIEEVEFILITLTDMVGIFNKIFGWPIVWIVARSVLQNLESLNFTVRDTDLGGKPVDGTNFIPVFVNIIFTLVTIVMISGIMLAFDYAKIEIESTRLLCLKAKRNFSRYSLESKALEDLSKAAVPVEFTAARFFELDRRILLGIFATTTTYFIVMLQF